MTVSIRTDPPVEHATGVTNRIRSRMPEMSGVMLRIADYLLENPDAPLTLTIGELAADSGVSAATITRFCRIIGYTGYAPFRVDLAKDFGRSTARDSWQTDIGRAFGPDDSAPDVLSTLLNAHTRTLRETADVIDLEVMLEIAAAIARSRNVDIYGVGGSAGRPRGRRPRGAWSCARSSAARRTGTTDPGRTADRAWRRGRRAAGTVRGPR